LKNKDKWLLLDLDSEESKKQRERPVQFPEVEEAITLWVINMLKQILLLILIFYVKKQNFLLGILKLIILKLLMVGFLILKNVIT